MPEISLIVPVYNVENYLKECLDSIVNQSFRDIEIICIDDGSTDGSLDILKEYAEFDDRFVIYATKHMGAGVARNKGIELSRGKYLQFLDADDYFESDMLKILYDKAEEMQADLVVCSARKVDNTGSIIESGNPNWPLNVTSVPLDIPFSWRDYPENIFSLFCVIPWNKLYLASLIKKHKLYFQNLKSSNDVGFSHIARICAERIVVINKELINYRYKRNGSISTYRADYTINIVEACKFVKNFLLQKGLYNQLEYAFSTAFKNHLRAGIAHCNDKQYENFLKQFSETEPELMQKYKDVFIKDFITIEYINNFIKNKKVMFWGASLFIREVLAGEKERNPNILGIIDKNTALWGKMCGNYEIYSPDILKTKKPDAILLTVFSNHENIYPSLKYEINKCYSDIEMMPDIFNIDSNLYPEKSNIVPESISTVCYTLEQNKLQTDKYFKELLAANIFNNLIKSVEWIKLTDFLPVKNAATYSFLYFLFVVLEYLSPEKILEFGMGQTSKLTSQYVAYKNQNASLQIVEHDKNWIKFFSQQIPIKENIKIIHKNLVQFDMNGTLNDKYENLSDITDTNKYNLIVIDGPVGAHRTYPRTNIVDLIPKHLAEDFIIILDDAERDGEKNLASLVFRKLEEKNIRYKSNLREATKTQLVITSENYSFLGYY